MRGDGSADQQPQLNNKCNKFWLGFWGLAGERMWDRPWNRSGVAEVGGLHGAGETNPLMSDSYGILRGDAFLHIVDGYWIFDLGSRLALDIHAGESLRI